MRRRTFGSAIFITASSLSAQQVSLVSVNFNGTGSGDRQSRANGDGYRHVAMGRYVGFTSFASNIVPNGFFVNTAQLYVRDLQTGTTQLITADYQTGESGICGSDKFEFSQDGHYLAFLSCDRNLMPGTPNIETRLFLRDMQTGALRIAVVDVTSPDVRSSPFRVARAIGLDMQPIEFGHHVRRLPSTRLAALLGKRAMNPDPHPVA